SFESALNLNRDLALNLHYQLQSIAGAKSVSAWGLGATDPNIGVIFSLRPASNGLRIAVPSRTLSGDVMVASVAVRPGGPVPPPAIVHVGAGAVQSNDSNCPRSVTPAIPAGNAGDLLIALVNVREDSA